MTTFENREKAFESQFAHSEAVRFKARARRNNLLGFWAANKLGLAGAEAETYVRAIVISDVEDANDEELFRKIRRDFFAKGVNQSDHQIHRTMEELMDKAMNEIKATG